MNENGLVSIIIPTYNRALCYIAKAIQSITEQTYKNYEIIVVDDNIYGSNYARKIREYCVKNNFIYLTTKGREGANTARNIGARYAKGIYLTFLDDDDFWLKNKLEMQLKYFNDNVGMVYSNGYVFTSNSKHLYTKPECFVTEGNLYKLFLYNYIGPTVTAIIKRDCFFDVGMFDEDLPAKQDYDLWIRIVKKYKAVGINQPLFVYTRHDSNQITKKNDLILEGYNKIYKKYESYLKNDFIINFFFYLKIAKIYKNQKNFLKYYKCIFTACSNMRLENLKIIF
ncbi:MAG: glycosyltransferase family 2 protein [Lachnospiraceae bacterium]|nr:glycosyltransferase family 2 protein [Lachnospiraceae bacterium]